MIRVLVTGARAPVALHLARHLAARGCEVTLADTLAHPLAASSRAMARYVRLPPPDAAAAAFRDALQAAIRTWRIDLVIPTCEEVFYLAWAFETADMNARLYAPPFGSLARAHDKGAFARDAALFGMTPPETQLIVAPVAVATLRPAAHALVFKPVWSRFADRVLMRPAKEDLARIRPTPRAPWIAQEYIPGEEVCGYAVAHGGDLVAWAAYRPTHRAGAGAGIHLTPVRDADVAQACATYIRQTGWTGQISFDFRRDAAGRLRVLECNPRATSGIYFFGHGPALASAILDGAAATPDIATPLMIPAAMWLYGLPAAVGDRNVGGWWRDWRAAGDALAWPGDRMPFFAQPRAIAELAAIAWRERTSLLAASTSGIAWNGAPIGACREPDPTSRPFAAE